MILRFLFFCLVVASWNPQQAIAQVLTPGMADTAFNMGRSQALLNNPNNPAPGEGPNRSVRALAIQSNGKVLIGGEFTQFNGMPRSRIVRLDVNGVIDTSFNTQGTGFSSDVTRIAVQPDDKLVVAGLFGSYNGIARPRLARLHQNGQLDTSFNVGTGVNSSIEAVVLLADGKILIGGSFTAYNGVARNRIARLHANGSLDTTFNPAVGANNWVRGIAVQPDGKLVIAGDFTSFGGAVRNGIARIHANGSLDTTFDAGLGSTQSVHAIALTADGKMFVGGFFQNFAGRPCRGLVRLHADGRLDTTVSQAMGVNGTVRMITVLPDGRLLVSGSISEANGRPRIVVARLFSDGNLDTTYNEGEGTFNDGAGHVLQADGKLVIAGGFSSIQGYTRIAVTRLNADGTLDVNYNPVVGIRGNVFNMATLPDGRIYVVGNFNQFDDVSRNRIARLHPDGRLDTSFNPGLGANNAIFSVAIQPDGRLIIVGIFSSYDGVPSNNVARLHPDGRLDTSFSAGSGTNSFVIKTLIQADGKVLILGLFGVYNGAVREYIARLHPNGTLDTSFLPGTFSAGWSNSVWMQDMALQPDGKILVGGTFSSFNGIPRNNILRLNTDGSLDTSFNSSPGAGGTVRTIVLLPDGKLYVGGEFMSYGSAFRNRIARVNADGSLDASFAPPGGFNDIVIAIAVQADSLVLVGGTFSTANTLPRQRFVRLFPSGQVDTSYHIGSGFNESVTAIVMQPDGKALVSGAFSAYNGTFTPRIARILGGECTGLVSNTTSTAPICMGDTKSLIGTAGGRWVITSGSGNIVGNTYFPSATGGTVTIIKLIGSCASPAVSFQVNALPQPPFVLPVPAICSGRSATISPLVGGASYLFWSDSVGGVPLNGPAGTTSFTTPGLTSNTTYYVSSLSAVGCESSARTAVSLTVQPNPAVSISLQNDTLWADVSSGSFQWFNDSTAIAGATSSYFVPTQTGNYWLRLTNAAGCSAISNTVNVVISSSNVNELAKQMHWKAYPVPFDEQLTLEAEAPFSFELIDVRGVVVLKGTSLDQSTLLETGSLASGVYVVKLVVNGQSHLRRVVKR